MDIKRLGLYFVLAILAVALWNSWQKDYPPAAVKQAAQQQQQQRQQQDFAPQTFAPSATTIPGAPVKRRVKQAAVVKGRLIDVKTKVLDLKFAANSGNLVSAKLLKYPIALKKPDVPVQLFNKNRNKLYIAQTGLTDGKIRFSGARILHGDKNLTVQFTGVSKKGVRVVKSYIVPLDGYAIKLQYKLQNNSGRTWRGSVYNQIVRRYTPMDKSFFQTRSYYGAAISSPDKTYEKISFKDMNKANLSRNIKGGWVAMQQHYFLSAWVPAQESIYHYYSHVTGQSDDGKNSLFTIGFVSPQMTLSPGKSSQYSADLYVGPEIASNLKPLAKGLAMTVDYGWLWWISVPIFKVMKWIHDYVGNWGWTIVLITLLIKLIFYKLSDKSYRSMAKMRDVQPRMAALKERYGDDKQALSKATMEFYKKEKVNPVGGCLPMLIQIPVFFALYYVLIESVQLRQAPFIFWIQDLSVKDPYYVLPILMGLSMLLQQKLSPPPPDPTQAKVMMLLPLIFTVLFATFPAGLVLYWFVNNCASVAQQWYVMKTYDAKAEAQKAKAKAKAAKRKQ